MIFKTSEEKMKQDALKWNKRHTDDFMPTSQSELLVKFADILPLGRVLDIACGNGRNSKFLADRGFICECIDISSVAISKLVDIKGIIPVCLDLDQYQITPNGYEVILDFYFLDRRLFDGIKRGLKRGGIFLMETFIADEDYPIAVCEQKVLCKGELEEIFSDFEILFHNEIFIDRLGEKSKAVQFCAKKKAR